MLKKPNRLPGGTKLKQSSYFKTPNFTLRVSSNGLPDSRFGFVVKKTTDKKAVVRNRTRRVFRSCIEEILEIIKPGYDMLFVLEKGIIGKERKEVFAEIQKFLLEKKLLH